MSIEVKSLVKKYGEQKAVNEISFKINKGEIVGFLGPNGAGKSTTMKIITGYLEQTAGEAFVCGLNVNKQPLETKKKIGYLPELNALYYEMYVREYLAFVAEVHAVKDIEKRIKAVVDTVGLNTEARKKIGQLSKGYKQRVGLAAALIHDPEVLVLDEPTSGLDPNQIVEIREVIKQQGSDKTVLFSSHILQEVEAICDRVIIIHQGRIVADDKLSTLRQNTIHQPTINVAFNEFVNVDWLKKLSSVIEVKEEGKNNFTIVSKDPEQVKKQVLQLAIDKNLNIVSLQSGTQSLETIFKSLTN